MGAPPTTTSITMSNTISMVGCCFGSTSKAQSKCAAFDEPNSCERRRCTWLETDDPSDCALTTTQEQGCCSGDTQRKNLMCNGRSSRKTCERAESCTWNSG